MSTLGYGDLTPTTFDEKVFITAVALLSCFTFAYSMSNVGEILKEFGRAKAEFKEKMGFLNIYMD